MRTKDPSTLVVYYSNTGNNRFLAEKIADSLNTKAVELRPVLGGQILLMALSFMGIGIVPKTMDVNIEDYNHVILCGPIWSGTLISPLRGFLGKYRSKIKSLTFVTCCGSIDEDKDGRFGYNRIFNKVKKLMGSKMKYCEAFPISLTLTEDKRKDEKAVLELRLTEKNFKDEIKERFNRFISSFTSRSSMHSKAEMVH